MDDIDHIGNLNYDCLQSAIEILDKERELSRKRSKITTDLKKLGMAQIRSLYIEIAQDEEDISMKSLKDFLHPNGFDLYDEDMYAIL